MQVKIKKLVDNAVIPSYAKPGDAGLDLTAASIEDDDGTLITYDTGLAFEIPEGYVGLVYPRSSIYKYDLVLSNHVGVIDSSYRGSVKFKFRYAGEWASPYTHSTDTVMRIGKIYNVGDRIGQIIITPYPKVELIESIELSSTERGSGGYGSTDKKEPSGAW